MKISAKDELRTDILYCDILLWKQKSIDMISKTQPEMIINRIVREIIKHFGYSYFSSVMIKYSIQNLCYSSH